MNLKELLEKTVAAGSARNLVDELELEGNLDVKGISHREASENSRDGDSDIVWL